MKSLFIKKPDRALMYTVKDLDYGRKWAKSQPNPFRKNSTLWDFCYDKNDIQNTIFNINKFIQLKD